MSLSVPANIWNSACSGLTRLEFQISGSFIRSTLFIGLPVCRIPEASSRTRGIYLWKDGRQNLGHDDCRL